MLSKANEFQTSYELQTGISNEFDSSLPKLQKLCALLEVLTQENIALKAELAAQRNEYKKIISSLLGVQSKVNKLGITISDSNKNVVQDVVVAEVGVELDQPNSESRENNAILSMLEGAENKDDRIALKISNTHYEILLSQTEPHLDIRSPTKRLAADGLNSLDIDGGSLPVVIEALREVALRAEQFLSKGIARKEKIEAEIQALVRELEKLKETKICYKAIQEKEMQLDGDYACLQVVLKSAALKGKNLGDFTFRLATAAILQNGPLRFPRIEIHPSKNSGEFPLKAFLTGKEEHLNHYELRFDTEVNEVDVGAFNRLDDEAKRVVLALIELLSKITKSEKYKLGQERMLSSSWHPISEKIKALADQYLLCDQDLQKSTDKN